MVQERHFTDVLVDVLLHFLLVFLAFVCLAPFLHVASLSLSSHGAISSGKVGLWPVGIHNQNFRYIMKDEIFVSSFGVSVARVLIGVVLNLIVMVLTAYPLSRDHIHMPGRQVFKVLMLIGMMFSGGLIPYFLALRNLGLLNKFWVLVVPGALQIFSTIIIINFFRGIPRELSEAALIDGASHFDVLVRIFLPVSLPALATVTLFSAVGHWNSWFDGVIFLKEAKQWPLQSYLYSRVTTRMLQWATGGGTGREGERFLEATPEGLGAAMILIASIPILCVYPLLQRYFVTGLTLGAVKG